MPYQYAWSRAESVKASFSEPLLQTEIIWKLHSDPVVALPWIRCCIVYNNYLYLIALNKQQMKWTQF